MRYAVTVAALVLTVSLSACATGASEQQFTRADADAIEAVERDLREGRCTTRVALNEQADRIRGDK